MVSYFKELI